jgi:uncharacterized tellurite resistance protein B-like protein
MNNEKIKKYIEYGKKASKDAQASNTAFYDMLDTMEDLSNELNLKILKHQKSIATADNSFSNGIRSLITKEVNAELKAMKENK